jgi:hypothetical protein
LTNNPGTTPDRDAALSAFARQHPAWTVWRSLNTRFYAILTARPIEKVLAETLPELSIEIRAHETYVASLDREETAYQARLANIARRKDSGEYDEGQAREAGLRLREEYLVITRTIRETRFGQS